MSRCVFDIALRPSSVPTSLSHRDQAQPELTADALLHLAMVTFPGWVTSPRGQMAVEG
jgi:hypothetical protein